MEIPAPKSMSIRMSVGGEMVERDWSPDRMWVAVPAAKAGNEGGEGRQ